MAKKNKKDHHLKKREDVWYFVAMVNGKRITKALSASITEARRIRDKYLKEISVYGDIQRSFQTEDKDVHQHMLQSKEFEMVGWGVNVHLWIYRAKFSSIQDARKALNLKH